MYFQKASREHFLRQNGKEHGKERDVFPDANAVFKDPVLAISMKYAWGPQDDQMNRKTCSAEIRQNNQAASTH